MDDNALEAWSLYRHGDKVKDSNALALKELALSDSSQLRNLIILTNLTPSFDSNLSLMQYPSFE